MLEIAGLHAGYGKKRVLQGLDLEVRAGEVLAVLGANGAGKSTVIKAVAGIASVTAGSIRFEGKDLGRLPTHRLLSKGIGYVNQGKVIFESLSVRENLLVALEAGDFPRERIEEVEERFPVLVEARNRSASALSGGERQQLALARALLARPRLLLLDEPSLGLSPLLQDALFSHLARLASEGLAVLVVEQNAKRALAICHRAVVLESGVVALEGGPELRDDPRLARLYLGGHSATKERTP